MKTIYPHVETTGRYLFRETPEHPGQPHLARLAWVIADGDKIVSEWCNLIFPAPGYVYEPDAVAGHGITFDAAMKRGIPIASAMTQFVAALETVDRVCAFNMDFVEKVLDRSAFECGLNWDALFAQHTMACAMRRATDIVQKPRQAPGGGYSWPKFGEAYWFFANMELPPMDMDPVERGKALARCVYEIDQGILYTQRTTPHE